MSPSKNESHLTTLNLSFFKKYSQIEDESKEVDWPEDEEEEYEFSDGDSNENVLEFNDNDTNTKNLGIELITYLDLFYYFNEKKKS